MTSTTNEYMPNYSVLPGDHILELLEVYGMSQKELAERSGVTPKHINTVIKGGARITPELACSLGLIFEYPAEMWLRLQNTYDISVLEKKKEEELERDAEFLSEFDYGDLVKASYVPSANRIAEKIKHLLRFFQVANTEAYRKQWFAESASFRMAGIKSVKRGNIAAWIRYGQITANKKLSEYPRYNKILFIKALDIIKDLTVRDVFQDDMTMLCKNAGVILLFIKELPKTAICGATYWVNLDKIPCIQISFRFKSNDHFWFTFFHEAYHILEHHEKTMFVDLHNGIKDDIELAADAYSADKLIAPHAYRVFLSHGRFDKASIIAFAQQINRHPGIVVGRLQHDRLIDYNAHNGLKQKMSWGE